MGVENNEAIIAITWDRELIPQIMKWISGRDIEEKSLFSIVPALCNGKISIILAPDGSKKGWDTADKIKKLRDDFILELEKFAYDDGSNPFNWVEVGFGEFGQKVLRGNNKNCYGDSEYAGQQ